MKENEREQTNINTTRVYNVQAQERKVKYRYNKIHPPTSTVLTKSIYPTIEPKLINRSIDPIQTINLMKKKQLTQVSSQEINILITATQHWTMQSSTIECINTTRYKKQNNTNANTVRYL